MTPSLTELTAENERLTRENAEQLEVIVHLQADVREMRAEIEKLRELLTTG
jgi:hypothetical protein